jgi:hypothetical protein
VVSQLECAERVQLDDLEADHAGCSEQQARHRGFSLGLGVASSTKPAPGRLIEYTSRTTSSRYSCHGARISAAAYRALWLTSASSGGHPIAKSFTISPRFAI